MRNHSHNFAHFFPSWSRPELVVRASPIRAKYRFITDGCTAVDDAANHAGNCQHACQNGTGSPSAIVDYRRMRFCELKTVQQHRWWVMDRCYWYINDGDNDGGDDDDRMWIGFHIWYDIDVTSSSVLGRLRLPWFVKLDTVWFSKTWEAPKQHIFHDVPLPGLWQQMANTIGALTWSFWSILLSQKKCHRLIKSKFQFSSQQVATNCMHFCCNYYFVNMLLF